MNRLSADGLVKFNSPDAGSASLHTRRRVTDIINYP